MLKSSNNSINNSYSYPYFNDLTWKLNSQGNLVSSQAPVKLIQTYKKFITEKLLDKKLVPEEIWSALSVMVNESNEDNIVIPQVIIEQYLNPALVNATDSSFNQTSMSRLIRHHSLVNTNYQEKILLGDPLGDPVIKCTFGRCPYEFYPTIVEDEIREVILVDQNAEDLSLKIATITDTLFQKIDISPEEKEVISSILIEINPTYTLNHQIYCVIPVNILTKIFGNYDFRLVNTSNNYQPVYSPIKNLVQTTPGISNNNKSNEQQKILKPEDVRNHTRSIVPQSLVLTDTYKEPIEKSFPPDMPPGVLAPMIQEVYIKYIFGPLLKTLDQEFESTPEEYLKLIEALLNPTIFTVENITDQFVKPKFINIIVEDIKQKQSHVETRKNPDKTIFDSSYEKINALAMNDKIIFSGTASLKEIVYLLVEKNYSIENILGFISMNLGAKSRVAQTITAIKKFQQYVNGEFEPNTSKIQGKNDAQGLKALVVSYLNLKIDLIKTQIAEQNEQKLKREFEETLRRKFAEENNTQLTSKEADLKAEVSELKTRLFYMEGELANLKLQFKLLENTRSSSSRPTGKEESIKNSSDPHTKNIKTSNQAEEKENKMSEEISTNSVHFNDKIEIAEERNNASAKRKNLELSVTIPKKHNLGSSPSAYSMFKKPRCALSTIMPEMPKLLTTELVEKTNNCESKEDLKGTTLRRCMSESSLAKRKLILDNNAEQDQQDPLKMGKN